MRTLSQRPESALLAKKEELEREAERSPLGSVKKRNRRWVAQIDAELVRRAEELERAQGRLL
ncbi:hypothetical protein [Aminirod propionatiphilus]|uniref:Uncharacterized protein n=1 Tax=Aminirod propionatiphilus TaxID=3415223 RepID=A0ACD1DXZ2_9BACT|nr:hypothetical protein KIH16_04390 [Synergistota bacterium]